MTIDRSLDIDRVGVVFHFRRIATKIYHIRIYLSVMQGAALELHDLSLSTTGPSQAPQPHRVTPIIEQALTEEVCVSL